MDGFGVRSISINFRYKVNAVDVVGQEQNCPIIGMRKILFADAKLHSKSW